MEPAVVDARHTRNDPSATGNLASKRSSYWPGACGPASDDQLRGVSAGDADVGDFCAGSSLPPSVRCSHCSSRRPTIRSVNAMTRATKTIRHCPTPQAMPTQAAAREGGDAKPQQNFRPVQQCDDLQSRKDRPTSATPQSPNPILAPKAAHFISAGAPAGRIRRSRACR
jgi:hypothetical protein